MQVKPILNRVPLHRDFVYGSIRWREIPGRLVLVIEISPRKGSRPACSRCGQICPGYDTQKQRRFEFVPLLGIALFFLYTMWRVERPDCWIRVEQLPWAEGKKHLITTYAWLFAGWAKRLSWLEVARAFQTRWDNVYRAVQMVVEWGLAHRNLDNVTAIGTDEICWRKKKERFATLFYQLDAGRRRLLWIDRERTLNTFRALFDWFGPEGSKQLRFICSDMWWPYLQIIAKRAPDAVNVIDRFHVMRHMNKAIDDIRAKETKSLRTKGKEAVLTGSRWACWNGQRTSPIIRWIACRTCSPATLTICSKRMSSGSGNIILRHGLTGSSTTGA